MTWQHGQDRVVLALHLDWNRETHDKLVSPYFYLFFKFLHEHMWTCYLYLTQV